MSIEAIQPPPSLEWQESANPIGKVSKLEVGLGVGALTFGETSESQAGTFIEVKTEKTPVISRESTLGIMATTVADHTIGCQQRSSGYRKRKPEVSTAMSDAKRGTLEHRSLPKFTIRNAQPSDIDTMVEIDLRSFSKVYEGYGEDDATQRVRLKEIFNARYNLLGGKWMPVICQRDKDGSDKVVGFMHCCPTNKNPEDFVSWEQTTNNGRLDTLYDQNGKNAYVVTLSMDPSVKGQRGQNLLFAEQLATFIGDGMNTAFFESRMPGLRNWAERQCSKLGVKADNLGENDKLALAQEYFELKRERKGKLVPLDPLLKVYDGFGCNLLRVVPNAYKDGPSMNFGVLCTLENPIPQWARNSKIVSGAVKGVLNLVSKSSWLSGKAFS